jgi:NitT/TauT family transport system ATP-binding protein
VARHVDLDAADIDKFPVELSGGMRQRVAIARALAPDPDFVFFDEPFTALDVALKRRMQNLVIAAAAATGFAALFVTHDLFEATRIAHRIVVMDARGRGIAGERVVPGVPGQRADREVFERVSGYLAEDALFRHVNDVDERRLA